jgi:hypothetical protein
VTAELLRRYGWEKAKVSRDSEGQSRVPRIQGQALGGRLRSRPFSSTRPGLRLRAGIPGLGRGVTSRKKAVLSLEERELTLWGEALGLRERVTSQKKAIFCLEEGAPSLRSRVLSQKKAIFCLEEGVERSRFAAVMAAEGARP